MKNKEKILSIVIPCRNEEKYIGKLLNSLEKQSYDMKNVKIYIADADSIDKTIKIINKNKKLNIRIIKGGMPSVGRNNGTKLCKTKYILFIDADIELDDSKIIEKSIYLMETKNLKCATTNIRCKGGNKLDDLIFSFNNLVTKCSKCIAPYATGMYMMFEKEKFNELGGFDENVNYAEDYFLTKKLRAGEFGFVKGYIYTTNRRFRKIGYCKTIVYFIKIAFMGWDNDYFYKDKGYWD